jgi:hypothetical protein
MAYCAVHDDYEGVAVVAAGLAAPIAVAHALVSYQLRVACVEIGDSTCSEDRLAFELISPIATSTTAFHHVVEMFELLNAEAFEELRRSSSCFSRRDSLDCQW